METVAVDSRAVMWERVRLVPSCMMLASWLDRRGFRAPEPGAAGTAPVAVTLASVMLAGPKCWLVGWFLEALGGFCQV